MAERILTRAQRAPSAATAAPAAVSNNPQKARQAEAQAAVQTSRAGLLKVLALVAMAGGAAAIHMVQNSTGANAPTGWVTPGDAATPPPPGMAVDTADERDSAAPPPPEPIDPPKKYTEEAEDAVDAVQELYRDKTAEGATPLPAEIQATVDDALGLGPDTPENERREKEAALEEALIRRFGQDRNKPAEAKEGEKAWYEKIADWFAGLESGQNVYRPIPRELSPRAQRKLEEQTAQYDAEKDDRTGNTVGKSLLDQAIDADLVIEHIGGRDVVCKAPVMERLLWANEEMEWVIGEGEGVVIGEKAGKYPENGSKTHFRCNQDQFELEDSGNFEIVGPIVLSYHLLGQAIDCKNCDGNNTKDKMRKEILMKYGFRWGVKIKEGAKKYKLQGKRLWEGAMSLITGGASLEQLDNMIAESEVSDRVHYDMPASVLKETEDQAKKAREEFLAKKAAGDKTPAKKTGKKGKKKK